MQCIELNQAKSGLNLNQTFARQMRLCIGLKPELNDGQINPIDILRYPGVVEDAGVDVDELSQELLASFNALLDDFIAMRAREGKSWRKRLALVYKQLPLK